MTAFPPYPTTRPRRLRINRTLRGLIQETRLSPKDFIYPIFVNESLTESKPITSMPGQWQWCLSDVAKVARNCESKGIKSIMLFGIPAKKDATGSGNLFSHSIMPRAIAEIKNACPDTLVVSDICLCDYAEHGHCFIIDPKTRTFDNHKTLAYLQNASLVHAKAGSDMLAPSGMVDGMITAMRHCLDENGYAEMPIMSYSVKYASSFYGPFREALDSTPAFGDRKSHQMDYANPSEALKECALDIAEGADMLMIKPALSYLDIISKVKSQYQLPLAAYQVSGEYSMIHAAAQNGWVDLKGTALESLTSIKRAGADVILSYFAPQIADWLDS